MANFLLQIWVILENHHRIKCRAKVAPALIAHWAAALVVRWRLLASLSASTKSPKIAMLPSAASQEDRTCRRYVRFIYLIFLVLITLKRLRPWVDFSEEVAVRTRTVFRTLWPNSGGESELSNLFLHFYRGTSLKNKLIIGNSFDASPGADKTNSLFRPDLVFCPKLLPYFCFSLLVTELKAPGISIFPLNKGSGLRAATQLFSYLRSVMYLGRLYDRSLAYGLLLNGKMAVFLKMKRERQNILAFYYSEPVSSSDDPVAFNRLLWTFANLALSSFTEIFCKPAFDHRFVTYLYKHFEAELVQKKFIQIDIFPKLPRFHVGSIVVKHHFPVLSYWSAISSIYISGSIVVKVSPYGADRMFIDREARFYKMARERALPGVLPLLACVRTQDSTFLVLPTAIPVLSVKHPKKTTNFLAVPGSQEAASAVDLTSLDMSQFSLLVHTLRIIHQDLHMVHCDIRPQNVVLFQENFCLIDFAYAESYLEESPSKIIKAVFHLLVSQGDTSSLKQLVKFLLKFFENLIDETIASSNERMGESSSSFQSVFERKAPVLSTELKKSFSEVDSFIMNMITMLFSKASERHQGNFSDFSQEMQRIFSYPIEHFVEYRGSKWSASNRILESNFVVHPEPRDDLESLAKTFILLKSPKVYRALTSTPEEGSSVWLEFWSNINENGQILLRAARTLNYTLLAQLMDDQGSLATVDYFI